MLPNENAAREQKTSRFLNHPVMRRDRACVVGIIAALAPTAFATRSLLYFPDRDVPTRSTAVRRRVRAAGYRFKSADVASVAICTMRLSAFKGRSKMVVPLPADY